MNKPVTRIYGITYAEGQETEYIPFMNTCKINTWRFEFNAMFQILQMLEDLQPTDYIGMVSWKFRQKTGLQRYQVERQIERVLRNGARPDVFNFSPNLGHNIGGCGCFMDWSAHHKGHGETLRTLIKECCKILGWDYYNNPAHVVYANQFIATKQVYEKYLNEVITPCLNLLEGELWKVANVPAGYQVGLPKDELMKHTGLEFYNYVPFVLERMMMQFIANKNLNTVDCL